MTIIDAPGVHNDNRRLIGAQSIGDFDHAAGIVRKTPRPDFEVSPFVVDESFALVARYFLDWLHKFGVVA